MTSFPLVADISSYQPDEPAFFQALKNQGVKAVIVKITQGSADGDAYVNPKAKAQITNARAAGLLVHGYHYARFTGRQDAINEAKWFYQNATALGLGKESVLAVDAEDNALAHYATADVNTFLQYLIDQKHLNVDVYSMASWFWEKRLIQSELIAKNDWVANYGKSQPGVSPTAFQYSELVSTCPMTSTATTPTLRLATRMASLRSRLNRHQRRRLRFLFPIHGLMSWAIPGTRKKAAFCWACRCTFAGEREPIQQLSPCCRRVSS